MGYAISEWKNERCLEYYTRCPAICTTNGRYNNYCILRGAAKKTVHVHCHSSIHVVSKFQLLVLNIQIDLYGEE